MSDSLASAVEVVRKAEGALRGLMQSAVDAGEYDRVAVLARWAEHLSQIGVNSADHAGASVVELNRSNVPVARKPTSRAKRKHAKSKYPVFKRSGDNLVKVAWSRASKSEYQHQAPKSIVLALVQKMQISMSDDALITMDEVLPLVTNDHVEVPSYQSYVSLAWLRTIGVVEQHGRRGYSVASKDVAKKTIEKAWAGLPVHRS